MQYPKKLPTHDILEFSEQAIQKDTSAYIHTLNSGRFSKTLKMHSHSFYELNFITRGEGMHYVANNIIPVCKGSFFMIPPHIRHGYWSEEEFSIFHILISSKFLCEYRSLLEKERGYFSLFDIQPLLQHKLNHTFFPKIDGSLLTYLTALSDRMSELYSNEPDKIPTLGTYLIICFLLELESFITKSNLSSEKSNKQTQMLSALEYIILNFSKSLNFEEVAEKFHMSYSSFYRNFIKVTSVSPSDFIMHYRLKHAKDMITYTNLTITEIAQNTGFYDSAHLTRNFFKSTHMTPTEYRNFSTQKNECI